jgi:hypothetical protein
MDNEARLKLEDLPDPGAIEHAREAIQNSFQDGGSQLASIEWDPVKGTIGDALRDKLADLDPLACVSEAWCTASRLRLLAKKTKAAPGTKESLTLGDHSLSSDMYPVVALSYGPLTLRELRFTLRFDAVVKWVVLIIAEGKIASIEGADLTVSASLYYQKYQLSRLLEQKFTVSAPHVFADGGITIPCD